MQHYNFDEESHLAMPAAPRWAPIQKTPWSTTTAKVIMFQCSQFVPCWLFGVPDHGRLSADGHGGGIELSDGRIHSPAEAVVRVAQRILPHSRKGAVKLPVRTKMISEEQL
jgi:hypothetical protein